MATSIAEMGKGKPWQDVEKLLEGFRVTLEWGDSGWV